MQFFFFLSQLTSMHEKRARVRFFTLLRWTFVFSIAIIINPRCSHLTPPPPGPGVLPEIGAAHHLYGGGSSRQPPRVHHLHVSQHGGARHGLRHVQAEHEMRKERLPFMSWSVSPGRNFTRMSVCFPRSTVSPRMGRCAAGARGPASDRSPSWRTKTRSHSRQSRCRRNSGFGPSTTTSSLTSSSICTHRTECLHYRFSHFSHFIWFFFTTCKTSNVFYSFYSICCW